MFLILTLFQWVVPHEVRIGWIHQDGEHRLYLEGSEVVQKIGLSAHYETRFRHCYCWHRNPPRLPRLAYEEYCDLWRKKAQNYNIVGGHGNPPELGLRSGIHKRMPKDIADRHRDLAPRDHQVCRPKVTKKNPASTSTQ